MIEERYAFLVIKKETLKELPKYLDYLFIEYLYKLEKNELILLDDNNNNLKCSFENRYVFRKVLEEIR